MRGEFLQGRGVVHDGILAALPDTALGHAVGSLGVEVVTVELSVSYLRPVREGLLQAQARVVHAGGRLFHATGEVLLEESEVALAKGIFYRVA